MSVIDKISIKDSGGSTVYYDIAADSTNVRYDNSTSIKDKVNAQEAAISNKINSTGGSLANAVAGAVNAQGSTSNIIASDPAATIWGKFNALLNEYGTHKGSPVFSQQGIHGIRYYNNALEVYDESTSSWGSVAGGDMLKSTYDTNDDGSVDQADSLKGLTSTITQLNYLASTTSNVQTQLDGKQNNLTFDSTPTLNSMNPVRSNGIYSALQDRIAKPGTASNGDVLTFNDGAWDAAPPASSGHEMILETVAGKSDQDIVNAINGPTTSADNHVCSAYHIQRWSNGQTKRFMIENTGAVDDPIGPTGIGTYDKTVEVIKAEPVGSEDPSSEGWYEVNPSTHLYELTSDVTVSQDKTYYTTVIDDTILSTWQYLAELENIDIENSNDIELKFKYDPIINQPIFIRGYLLDTDTNRICIAFANQILQDNLDKAKISLDINYLRNEIS